jgi:anti-sigma factor RsiW
MGSYGDGELDLVRTMEIEHHFETCPACWAEWQNHQALRSTLGARPLYYRAPVSLRRRVQRALWKDDATFLSFLPQLPTLRSSGIAAAASLAAAAFLAGSLFHPWSLAASRGAGEALTQEIISSHVRSLMADHLMDVASTDRHTVKPWFSGKLDFSPPVEDLKDRDFPLIGGRLDAIGGRPVAALVYRHRKHVINLYIWPSSPATVSEPAATSQRGYHLISWRQSDMIYCAISELNEGELREFIKQLRQRLDTR